MGKAKENSSVTKKRLKMRGVYQYVQPKELDMFLTPLMLLFTTASNVTLLLSFK
jgi:hypothetical protein